jgi:hypothetical protein
MPSRQIPASDETGAARILLPLAIVSIAVMLALMLYVFVLQPYFEARRLVQQRLIQGRPIVKAVYEYRRSSGRWPESLQDLVPHFLHELPSSEGNWSYWADDNGPPSLSVDAGPGTSLLYGFPPRTASLLPPGADSGWIIDGRDGEFFVATD